MSLRSYRTPTTRTLLLALSLACVSTACGGSDSPTAPDQTSVPYSQADLRVGTGAEATAGRQVTVNYTVWLYSDSSTDNKGAQVDSSAGRGPYAFILGTGAVIAGWDRGVAGMKAGGMRRLVVPPDLAYGSTGRGAVPPNAALVFEVELLSVQ